VNRALGIAVAAVALAWASPGRADEVAQCPQPGTPSFALDLTKAADACRQLAEKGEAYAQYDLAIIYDQGLGVNQNYKDAIKYYTTAATKGYAPAQDRLGTIYAKGILDMPLDYQQAANWYATAADQGYPQAQHALGVLYELGHGVPQNYAQALKFYTAAADQGYPQAQFALAYMYVNGKGVKVDFVQAYVWLDVAAAVNSDYADSRDQVGKRLTPEQIAKAQDQALQWKPKTLPATN
jgi:uncharacterized protein